MGTPVKGILAETDPKNGASHFNARIPVAYAERYADSHGEFNGLGLSVDRESISQLPSLGCGNIHRSNSADQKMLKRPRHLQDTAIRARDRAIADANQISAAVLRAIFATPHFH